MSFTPQIDVQSQPHELARSNDTNTLLNALSPEIGALLHDHMDRRYLKEGTVLWDAGEACTHIYFPHSGMISVRVPTESGQTVEVATVGREAAVGFHSDRIPAGITQAVVQIRGRFDCLAQADFRAAARDLGEDNVLERLAASCQGWLLLQAQQMAACNTLHSADARFCRWLLRASDSSANEIVWGTQETIAEALCVRRTTVTQIAQRLERAQIISYSRGKITVRDRAGLAAQSCRCPVVLTDQLNHLMASHGGAIAASLGEEQPGDGVSCCA